MGEAVIEMKGITKNFPGIKANDNVDLTLYAGEIHALLGENGAGKSTLMSVLTGTYKPDEGEFFHKSSKVRLKNPKHAVELGIGMVHQHFRLVEPLSVAENILLSDSAGGFFLNSKTASKKIMEYAEQFGLTIDCEAKIWQLSIGEQQRVEILKLLYQGMEVLILDEPTAVLTPREAGTLFGNLRRMADMNKAVVFITHKLGEVMSYADRITVMRAGKSVATMLKTETTKEELTKLMVGRELSHCENAGDDGGTGAEVLSFQGVTAYNDKNQPALRELNLEVHAGEILCIAGVAGNGQRELGETAAGLRRVVAGQIKLNGDDITNKTPKHIIKKGLSFIPEDRLGMGLIPNFNIMKNLILKNYDEEISSHGTIIKEKAIKDRAAAIVGKNNIQTTGLSRPVKLMSGGNQQKLLFARETDADPSVIIATYPARGLDIGATEAIHRIFLEQRAKGAAIILISEDLDEIFSLADRIAVLFEGGITGVLSKKDATFEQVGRLMLGEGSGKEVADIGNKA